MNDAYIWGAMLVDLRDITEKNAEEWAWRFAFASKLNGAMFHTTNTKTGKRSDYIPTLEDIKKRIGLTTSVSPKTRAQFVAKMVRNFKA